MSHSAELPDNPKISVVTVSYNQGEFIRQNIESVLAQNYPNFEHIVVDGGSKDQTLDILRSYPHLKWTSERDRNQSDGLNKGFARATGDIIAWLNSDDWYAPGCFHEIAKALKHHEVVLTQAAETDRAGNVTQVVKNTPRNFYDLLRYWVPYAWLAQTGVFFRRSLLERVKRGEREYVDEDLYFVMDVDLWLRMARQADFTHHLDKLCAYFRIYEENKTGKSPLATQRECSRVYLRHLNEICRAERKLTFVMPLNRISQEIAHTVQSLIGQQARDFDLIFVDYAGSTEESQNIKKIVEELEKSLNVMAIRYLRAGTLNPVEALNAGMLAAASPLVATAWPGDVFAPGFMAETLNVFSLDPTGLAVPVKDQPVLRQHLHDEKTYRLRFEGLLTEVDIPLSFVARKAALTEIGGLQAQMQPAHAMRRLLMELNARGWHVSTSNDLSVQPGNPAPAEDRELFSVFSDYIYADLVLEMSRISETPFAAIRKQHGWCPVLSDMAVQNARQVLASAPAGWQRLDFAANVESIQKTIASHPHFLPAIFLLAKKYELSGMPAEAQAAMKRYRELSGRRADG